MIALVVGQVLIWALGSAWVAVLWRRSFTSGDHSVLALHSRAIIVGYGYAAGTLFLTLWMRLLSVVGISWSWLSIAVPIVTLTALAVRQLPATERRELLRFGKVRVDDVAVAGSTSRLHVILWWTFGVLIGMHLLLAALEVIWRPLFPWDAWTQWATKARVWYEMSRQVPFSNGMTWFAGNSYIDAAPGYPANLPLLQVWASISAGRWDDSLINLPSLFLAVALATGLYGQMRYAGRGALLAIAAAYAVVSLPILDTHIALGGYADLPLAVYFSLSAIALWQWLDGGDRRQLVLAAALAIACPLTKNPGWVWLATLVPAVVIARSPVRGTLTIAIIALASALLMFAFGRTEMALMGYRVGMTYTSIWEPLWQNYYEFANWHLLWYLLQPLMIWNGRRLFQPPLIAGTVIVLCGLAFLFIGFSFSNAATWVSDYSTVNRATLHFAPVVVFYLFCLVHELVWDAAQHRRRAPSPG